MNNALCIVRPPNPPACPKLEGVFLIANIFQILEQYPILLVGPSSI
jgi:hypothetical protein